MLEVYRDAGYSHLEGLTCCEGRTVFTESAHRGVCMRRPGDRGGDCQLAVTCRRCLPRFTPTLSGPTICADIASGCFGVLMRGSIEFAVVFCAAASDLARLAAARRLCTASQPLYSHMFVPLSQQPGGAVLASQ